MGMQYDVKAVHITGDGSLLSYRTRVKGIQITGDGTAGDVILKDGGASGTTRLVIALTTSLVPFSVNIPGEGILFNDTVYADVPGSASITVFYG